MFLQLNHFFKVIRFKNLLILVLTQVLAFYFIVIPRLSFVVDNIVYLKAIIVMLSTMFVTAAGYLINDYYDVKLKTSRLDILSKYKNFKLHFCNLKNTGYNYFIYYHQHIYHVIIVLIHFSLH